MIRLDQLLVALATRVEAGSIPDEVATALVTAMRTEPKDPAVTGLWSRLLGDHPARMPETLLEAALDWPDPWVRATAWSLPFLDVDRVAAAIRTERVAKVRAAMACAHPLPAEVLEAALFPMTPTVARSMSTDWRVRQGQTRLPASVWVEILTKLDPTRPDAFVLDVAAEDDVAPAVVAAPAVPLALRLRACGNDVVPAEVVLATLAEVDTTHWVGPCSPGEQLRSAAAVTERGTVTLAELDALTALLEGHSNDGEKDRLLAQVAQRRAEIGEATEPGVQVARATASGQLVEIVRRLPAEVLADPMLRAAVLSSAHADITVLDVLADRAGLDRKQLLWQATTSGVPGWVWGDLGLAMECLAERPGPVWRSADPETQVRVLTGLASGELTTVANVWWLLLCDLDLDLDLDLDFDLGELLEELVDRVPVQVLDWSDPTDLRPDVAALLLRRFAVALGTEHTEPVQAALAREALGCVLDTDLPIGQIEVVVRAASAAS